MLSSAFDFYYNLERNTHEAECLQEANEYSSCLES